MPLARLGVFLPFTLAAAISPPQLAQLPSSSNLPQAAPAIANPVLAAENSMIVGLLQQSHDQAEQLSVFVRVNLLPRQAQMIVELNADLGRQWANELFVLSHQANGSQRPYLQGTAMRLLVRVDPDRALELLHAMNDEPEQLSPSQVSPKLSLAHQVFSTLAKRDGIRALPSLQEEAELMGAQGPYPYSALGAAAMQVVSADRPRDQQHVIEVVRSVFDPAFARYTQNSRGYADDLEFGKMLESIAGSLPLDVIQPALHLLVERLLATDTQKYRVETEIYDKDGRKLKADNAVDATLLWFGSLITRDPELTQHLETSRPELQALEYSKDGRQRSMRFGAVSETHDLWPRDPNAEMRSDALVLSHINPDAAIGKAEQLPDGEERTTAILEVARNIANSEPKRAAELITGVQSGYTPANEESQLNLISAQAAVASAQKQPDQLRELLSSGFELAARLVSESRGKTDSHLIPALGSLVQTGMRNDPDSTLAFLQGLPLSYEKADLLLGAASALQLEARRISVLRAQQQQKPEQQH